MSQFKRSHYEAVAAIIRSMNDRHTTLAGAAIKSEGVYEAGEANGYLGATNDVMNKFVALFKEDTPSFDVLKFVAKAGRK